MPVNGTNETETMLYSSNLEFFVDFPLISLQCRFFIVPLHTITPLYI